MRFWRLTLAVPLIILVGVFLLPITGMATKDGGPDSANLGGVSVTDGPMSGCLFFTISNVQVDDSDVVVAIVVTNGFTINGNRATATLSVPGGVDDNETILALEPRNQIPMDTRVTIPSGTSKVAALRVTTFDANNNQVCTDTKTATITHPAAAQQPGNQVSVIRGYDTNGNNRLEDSEFFRIIDDWVDGKISDADFFRAVDIWIGELPIGQAPPTEQPPPATGQNCANPGALVLYVNGLPGAASAAGFVSIDGAAVLINPGDNIGVGFSNDATFAQGTTFEPRIFTADPSFDMANAVFNQPLSGQFQNVGPQQIVGSGHLVQTVQIPRNRELIRFQVNQLPGQTPLPNSTIDINIAISGSGCPNLNLRTSQLVRFNNTAAASAVHLAHTPAGLLLESQSGAPVQVEIFSLAGQSLFASDYGQRHFIQTSGSRPWANGVYFYVVRTRSASGETATSAVKRLVILR